MAIVVVGLSHRTAPVILREQFAFAEASVPEALQELRRAGVASEAVILSTCNRVEIYAATDGAPQECCRELERFLVASRQYRGALNGEVYGLIEPDSVEHLFRVATGLDSMVLGETEILGQLKRAYEIALHEQHTGARLNKAFQRAFHVAKQLRTETSIQRGSTSVGSVAVELAEKVFDSLSDRSVLLLGAGDTSEKTARALLSRGARGIRVANRTFERAAALATELGGRAVRFEDWVRELGSVDIVISSTSAPHYVLEQAQLAAQLRRRHRPLLLIDLGVPRDIEPAINGMENVYLYNIDDLQQIADDYLQQRREEVARCETVIREKARGLIAGLGFAGGLALGPRG